MSGVQQAVFDVHAELDPLSPEYALDKDILKVYSITAFSLGNKLRRCSPFNGGSNASSSLKTETLLLSAKKHSASSPLRRGSSTPVLRMVPCIPSWLCNTTLLRPKFAGFLYEESAGSSWRMRSSCLAIHSKSERHLPGSLERERVDRPNIATCQCCLCFNSESAKSISIHSNFRVHTLRRSQMLKGALVVTCQCSNSAKSNFFNFRVGRLSQMLKGALAMEQERQT